MADFFWDRHYDDVDKASFLSLVVHSQANGNRCSDTLARDFMAIITKIIHEPEFKMATEDWKADIANETILHMIQIIPTYDRTRGGAFGYFYSCALHRMRRLLQKLNSDYERLEALKEAGITEREFVSSKRKILKSETHEGVAKKLSQMKVGVSEYASLPKAVGLAMRHTIRMIDNDCITILLAKARQANAT